MWIVLADLLALAESCEHGLASQRFPPPLTSPDPDPLSTEQLEGFS